MNDLSALLLAIDLIYAPSRVRRARARPLPGGVDFLLRVAVRDPEAELEAAQACGRPANVVCDAAIFFVEQVLFDPASDSYRVLGADSSASAAELRRNMALLLRCFHPDIERNRDRSTTTTRVTQAWNNLKTPRRRAEYDRSLSDLRAGGTPAKPSRWRTGAERHGHVRAALVRRARPNPPTPARKAERPGPLLRAILFLLGRPKSRGRPSS